MSSYPTPITEDIFNYIKSNFAPEDDFLKRLKSESLAKGLPEITISADQARYLQFLIRALNFKNIIEVGSLGGYSAISMARAMPDDGHLIAIEINSNYAEFIRKQVSNAGLENKIEVVNADAKDYLSNFKPDCYYDLIFVDADKINYRFYFDKSRELLRQGGIFSADNGLAFGEIVEDNPNRNLREVMAIREFNEYLINQNDYYTCLLTIGDGLILSLKL